jgi:hypothetical protein
MAMKKGGPNRTVHPWVDAHRGPDGAPGEPDPSLGSVRLSPEGGAGAWADPPATVAWVRGSCLPPVSRDIRDEEFAHHRKLFLTE